MTSSNLSGPFEPETGSSGSAAHRDLEWRETVKGVKPGDRFVRIATHRGFRRIRPGYLVPRPGADEAKSPLGRAVQGVKRLLIGNPIPTEQEIHQRLGKAKALAVFASDNISSSAYATEEVMRVLLLAGTGMLALTMPITIAIVIILAIVVASYRQVIRAYPNGGGSYLVAHENLGPPAGLTAAAALLIDYILTVAVSVSAGVAAITSAFPELFDQRVVISVAVVTVMTVLNLRGVRESANILAAPTYVYIAGIFGLLGLGFFRVATGTLPSYSAPTEWVAVQAAEPLTLLLVLRAFASGSVALTGTEAVSNGVPAFKSPEVNNSQIVLVAMGTLFGTIFMGISFLSGQIHIIPDPHETETVLSQLARTLVGTGPYYYLVQFATALLLVLAANTAFNGFPRLASILAHDRYLPRQFQFRGDRLAFTAGIIVLAFLSAMLIVAFEGSVTGLIPLYTVGVFIAFTLSQLGLVRYWWRRRDREPGWHLRAATNGLGCVATGIVAVAVTISKFILGAWMILVVLPIIISLFRAINIHYNRLVRARQAETPLSPEEVIIRAVVPVADLGVEARQALAYARSIAPDDDHVVMVHVVEDPAEAETFQRQWAEWGSNINLVIIESPFRSLIGPLLSYLDGLKETVPHDTITVVLPEFVPSQWWEHLLHNQTALRLKYALLFHPGIVVSSVPYHLATNVR